MSSVHKSKLRLQQLSGSAADVYDASAVSDTPVSIADSAASFADLGDLLKEYGRAIARISGKSDFTNNLRGLIDHDSGNIKIAGSDNDGVQSIILDQRDGAGRSLAHRARDELGGRERLVDITRRHPRFLGRFRDGAKTVTTVHVGAVVARRRGLPERVRRTNVHRHAGPAGRAQHAPRVRRGLPHVAVAAEARGHAEQVNCRILREPDERARVVDADVGHEYDGRAVGGDQGGDTEDYLREHCF